MSSAGSENCGLASGMSASPSRWGALVLSRCRALLLDGEEAVAALRSHIEARPSTDSTGHRYDYEYFRTLVSLGRLHEVSLRTVQVRLTTVHRRLGVRSRAQLMALLAGGREGAATTR